MRGCPFRVKQEPMARFVLLFGAAALVLAALAAPVSARDKGQGYYFDIGPDLNLLGDSELSSGAELAAESGLGAAIGTGYRFGSGLRAEFALGMRRNNLDSVSAAVTFFGTPLAANAELNGDITTVYGLLNGYYDFDIGSNWAPYLGLGIGAASIELDSAALGVDDTDTVPAWQGTLGLTYRISDNVWARGGYRYFGAADPEIAGAEFEIQSHVLDIGLQIGFSAF
jgi:OOP family OmpA-OmpF porin